MRVRRTGGATSATARLYDTARDFASLLPVTIGLHDLGGREKAGPLPRELAGGQGQRGYRPGQLGYWPPNHDLAIHYHDDGIPIPPPGIIPNGETEPGLDTIRGAGDGIGLVVTTDGDAAARPLMRATQHPKGTSP